MKCADTALHLCSSACPSAIFLEEYLVYNGQKIFEIFLSYTHTLWGYPWKRPQKLYSPRRSLYYDKLWKKINTIEDLIHITWVIYFIFLISGAQLIDLLRKKHAYNACIKKYIFWNYDSNEIPLTFLSFRSTQHITLLRRILLILSLILCNKRTLIDNLHQPLITCTLHQCLKQ